MFSQLDAHFHTFVESAVSQQLSVNISLLVFVEKYILNYHYYHSLIPFLEMIKPTSYQFSNTYSMTDCYYNTTGVCVCVYEGGVRVEWESGGGVGGEGDGDPHPHVNHSSPAH